MAYKTLEIKTATIEIKVIRVDGHKMTKATFNQIQEGGGNIDESNVLGWVKDNGTAVLWNDKGTIRRRYVMRFASTGGRYGTGFDGEDLRNLDSQGEAQMEKVNDYVRRRFDQLFIAT